MTTFQDFAQMWLATSAVVRLKPSAFAVYEGIVQRHLMPAFGSYRLPDITPEVVQCYVAQKMATGLSARTVRNQLIVLGRIMASAVSYGLIFENAVEVVVLPRLERTETSFLTPEQVRMLIDATPASWRLLVALPAMCGLRKGEVLALVWGDIDMDAMTISVTKSMRGGSTTTPKTKGSMSKVPMPESLVPYIVQRRRVAGDNDLVFCKRDGSPLSDATPNRVLARALDAAGLPHIRYHDLRGTWVVAHLRAGTDLKTLAHLGRWTSPETLLQTYAHVLDPLGGEAVANLDKLLREPE